MSKAKKKPAKKKAARKAGDGGRPWAVAALGHAWTGLRTAARYTAAGASAVTAGAAALWRWELGERRPARIVGWSLTALGMVALSGVAVSAALPQATGACTLRLLGAPPTWVTRDWADDALAEAHGSLYDSGRVAAVGLALRRSPWIASVDAVRRTELGLVAACTFRTPRFLVQRQSGLMVLDAQGVRLPTLTAETRATLGLIRLTGLRGQAPAVGKPWPSAERRAAVHVGELLYTAAVGVTTRLSRIDLRPVAGHVRVNLHTVDGGGHIEWGVAGGGKFEVAETERVTRLVELLREVQSFRTVKVAKLWTEQTRIFDR